MAYRCGLTDPVSFRGVAALSARIPDPAGLEARLPSSRSQSVFVTHGAQDPLIPLEEGRRSRSFLEAHGYNPDYREHEMGHEINQEVLEDLTGWIAGVLTPADLPREGV